LKSHTNPNFRKRFAALPAEVREQARAAYRLFRNNPRHPGLNFKRVHGAELYVSARVGRSYRAVGILTASDEVVWFWIGPHEEYERILYTL
jgi:transcription initiation factor TFIIIB Brf1 subunit/transcription initiation factor TFIIB